MDTATTAADANTSRGGVVDWTMWQFAWWEDDEPDDEPRENPLRRARVRSIGAVVAGAFDKVTRRHGF